MQSTVVTKDASGNVVTFSDLRQTNSGSFQWIAESPQGDIAGCPTLELSNSTSRTGIVTRRLVVRYPIWDATAGVYKGYRQRTESDSSPDYAALSGTEDLISICQGILDPNDVVATARTFTANTELTDDYIKARYGNS